MAALDDAPLSVDDRSRMKLPRWSSGRVAVVADPAWCATPASRPVQELTDLASPFTDPPASRYELPVAPTAGAIR